jgi:hypothetical protein
VIDDDERCVAASLPEECDVNVVLGRELSSEMLSPKSVSETVPSLAVTVLMSPVPLGTRVGKEHRRSRRH